MPTKWELAARAATRRAPNHCAAAGNIAATTFGEVANGKWPERFNICSNLRSKGTGGREIRSVEKTARSCDLGLESSKIRVTCIIGAAPTQTCNFASCDPRWV